MSKRSLRKPLYDLMSSRRDSGSRVTPAGDASDAEPNGRGGFRLTAGRSIRLPLGYLLLGAGAVILLSAVVYMIAFQRAKQIAEGEYDERFLEGNGAVQPLTRASDPLVEPNGGSAGANREQPTGSSPGRESPEPETAESRGPEGQWGALESDPRQHGLYYLVLAETRPEGARRLAQYCRDNGLEAYVLSRNNGRFRVFVLPGLESDGKADPREEPLREEVYRIGDAWKAQHPGESNLRDAYLLLCQR